MKLVDLHFQEWHDRVHINVIESISDNEPIDTTENRSVNIILAAFNEDESDREFEILRFDNMQQMSGKYIMLITY